MEYNTIYTVMKEYSKLSKMEKTIIECFHSLKDYKLGYTDFVKNVLHLDAKKNCSNVRKAFLNLVDKQIIIFEYSNSKYPTAYLSPFWIDALLKFGINN